MVAGISASRRTPASTRRPLVDDAVDQVLFVEPREVDPAGWAGGLEVGDGTRQAHLLVAPQLLGFLHVHRREADDLARQQASQPWQIDRSHRRDLRIAADRLAV